MTPLPRRFCDLCGHLLTEHDEHGYCAPCKTEDGPCVEQIEPLNGDSYNDAHAEDEKEETR